MYKSRKPIALFLTVMLCITLVTAHYSKTQVHGATETIVAPFVLDAVVKLLVVVSGAYLVDYLNENYDMELERSDVTQTITAVKTLFDIFRTTDGFKLMDKQTGEELSISADTSSVAGHMITGTTPDDAHDRAFYQWYNQNVSKKLGQYHIRVRQWSDTYGQYIDQFYAKDNPLELHQYVPAEYKDDFLQLFADMQEMVKSGFESNIDKNVSTSSSITPGINYLNALSDHASIFNDTSSSTYYAHMGMAVLNDANTVVIAYQNTGSTSFNMNVYESNGSIYLSFNSYHRIYFYDKNGNEIKSYFKSAYTYTTFPLDASTFNVFDGWGNVTIFGEPIKRTFNIEKYVDVALDIPSDSPVQEESSPVTVPLFPPVLDDSGNVALDHGDVQEVPVEEDQDGVPFVPDDWWTSVFDDFFGQTIPGDYDGSLTDMTQTQLLQEIASNTKPPQFTIVDLDAIYEKLKEKFGMFYQIKEFFEAIMNEDYSNPQRPQFTITFTGQLGIYGTYEYLNLDLYDQYRDYIFAFIVATGWFVTLKRIFGYIPKVLN